MMLSRSPEEAPISDRCPDTVPVPRPSEMSESPSCYEVEPPTLVRGQRIIVAFGEPPKRG